MPLRRALLAVCLFAAAFFVSGPLSAQTLTFTGQVYSPLGPPVSGSTALHGDPIPNILVFVADPNSPPPTFSQGLTVPTSSQTGCEAQPSLVPSSVLGSGLTDFSGTYTFNVAGTVSYPITVVIQAGKWRRQYQYTQAQIASYTSGTVVTLPILSMPSSQSQGDLPHIAVVTGSADAIECIFPQIGIATTEVTDPTGTGSINLFSGNASSGEVVSASSPTETQLVNPSATGAIPLTNYDMVIFGCQSWASGTADSDVRLYAKNVETYANTGGRVFGTHGEATWITTPSDWAGIATFGGSTNSGDTVTGKLSTDYTGEPTLAAWMAYIGALDVSVANLEFSLTNVFYNLTAVASPGQTWVTLPAQNNTPNQFSFDTPVSATGKPSASVNFTNTQTSFQLGNVGDSVVISVKNTSSSDTAAGLTLTLSLPASITPTSLVDSSGGAWACTIGSPATTATCILPSALAAGASDAVTLTFSIPNTATPGTYTITGTLTNGGLNQTNQCGRVLYNDYHVEDSVGRAYFSNGTYCPTGTKLTTAQKFLEYSLYNLSNFIAPTTSDSFVIQAPSTTTITTPLSSGTIPGVQTPIYYGQIIGDTNGVNAIVSTTAPAGTGNGTLTVAVDGTVVCTLQNTATQGVCPNAGFTGQNAGSHTVQAFYSGDATYQPSQSPVYPVTIQPDPTTTTLTSSASTLTYGTSVTFTATVADQYATATGTVNFYDGSTLLGAGTLDSTGVATLTFAPLGVGTHTITAVFPGSTNFVSSTSSAVTVVVNLPVSGTTTTLLSSANPAYQGQNITLTATVAQLPFTITVPTGLSNPAPTGTVSFYDGATLLGSSALGANLTTTLSTSTLSVGTHAITAVYSGDAVNVTSTSAVLSQVVQPNTFTLTVNPTSLNLIIGSPASIAVTITDNGNFNEPVQLSCSGQTVETLCAFATATIPAGGGTTTLTVTPQSPHPCTTTSRNDVPGTRWPIYAGAGALLLTLRRRRKLLGLVSFGLLLAALPLLNGCSTSGCTDFGVNPGTYTFTVTATSASPYAETQTQTMTMVVKP